MVRHKNRYMVIQINQQDKKDDSKLVIRPAALYNAIMQKVQQLHGDFGIAAIRAGFTAKYCNEQTRIAVVRARHGPHRFIASSLPLINVIEKKGVYLTTLYTGATIKQCFRFLLRYQQKIYDGFCATLKTDEEKLAMRETLLNFETLLEIA